MKQAQQYFRNRHVIRDMEDNIVFTGLTKIGELERASINAAKRESRRLQGGALGQGLLQVEV